MSKATLVRMRKDDPRVLRAMQKGYALGRMKLREAMFKKAQYDDRIMKFLAKHFLGYSDFRRKVPADKAEDAWSETEEMSMPEPIIPPDLVSEWARLRKLGEEYDNLWVPKPDGAPRSSG
jgi:hypothetical protein